MKSAAKLKTPAQWAKWRAKLKRDIAKARKDAAKHGINLDGSKIKKNPAVSVKAVRVKNFTGTITTMPNGQVKVVGMAKSGRSNPAGSKRYTIEHSNGDQYGTVEATSAKAALAKWKRSTGTHPGAAAKRGLRARLER